MKIAIVLPTRGLVFTRVEEAIEKFRLVENIRVYRSDSKRIPDGHNELAKLALLEGNSHIFFIEEDTVPPENALEKLLEAKADIACIDYSVNGWGCVTKNSQGEILWCGLGCTLVKREVLETMEYPYFRVDKQLRLNDWKWIDLPKDYIDNKNYGSLDIWFCLQARKRGFKITQVQGECDHLELESLGQRGINNGLHKINLKEKIKKNQTLIEG